MRSATLCAPKSIRRFCPELAGVAQGIRDAAVTFGATIDKAGIALEQRLNALQASNPGNPAIQSLSNQLTALVNLNRQGLVLEAAGQKKVVEELAQIDTEAKEIESPT